MAKMYLDDEGDSTPTTKQTSKPAPAYEPGFLEPGSRSDAIVRGFAQGATFGLAPKISAMLNPGDYATNLKQYLDANRAAAAAHPTASAVSNLVGAAPSLVATSAGSLPAQIAKQALMGGVESYGSSEKSGAELAKDVATGAAISGATASVLPAVGKAAGMARDVVKGTPNPKRIAEAAIKFKNAPMQPTAGQKAPGSAYAAWKELQDKTVANAAKGDQAIRNEGLRHYPKEVQEAVIASHNVNAPTVGSVLKDVATDAAVGAGATAIPTAFATEGDLGKTLAAGTSGAVGGALYGGRKAVTGPNARLRMPEAPAGAVERAAYDVTRPFVVAGQQAAASNIKETADVGTNPFSRLTNYLSQAEDATNPAVQQAAEQAQAVADNAEDPDAKRKASMILQQTPEGRAVGNSASPYRYLDTEE